MPLYGTLKSMPLPDLLQWLCNAQVTGTLQVERDRVSKSIHLSSGLIIGCSSDDPPQRLGHFLLSRGKITEEQLSEALHLQELSGQHLGMLLVELGALAPEELSSHLEAQAEETIYSLFDWDEAVFRFQENENDPSNVFPVGLRVEDVLLRGLKRYDEMREIREVFDDRGIVLKKTGKEVPAALQANRMGQVLWDQINGERTVAEILLQVHGSEYVVTKFLFELHRSRLVEIARVKTIEPPQRAEEGTEAASPAEAAVPSGAHPAPPPSNPEPPSAVPTVTAEPMANARTAPADATATQPVATVVAEPAPVATVVEPAAVVAEPAPPAAPVEAQAAPAPPAPVAATPAKPAATPAPAATPPPQPVVAQSPAEPDTPEADLEDLLSDFDPDIDLPAAPAVAETGLEPAPEPETAESGVVSLDDSAEHSLEKNLEKARGLMADSQFEQALEILDHVYREHPGEESLRRLTAEAEAAFVEKAYRHYLPPSKVLVLTREADSLESEDLSPSEFFLLSRIDGTWDIKSIIQIAPLRESDALRTLKRMRENGLIELHDP